MAGHNKRDYLPESMKDWLTTVKEDSPESTYKTRKTQIRAFYRWLDEHDINIEEFVERNNDQDLIDSHRPTLTEWYASWMSQEYADMTVDGRVTAARQFYDYLDAKGVVDSNPWDDFSLADIGLGNPQPQQDGEIDDDFIAIEPDEVEQLCEHVPEPRLRNELLIKLLWQTGIRQQEASDITIDDIDRDKRKITVHTAKTENNDTRSVFYQPNLDILMNQWIDGGYRDRFAVAEESDYLFLTHRKPMMSPRVINRMVVKAAKRAGIQSVLWTDGNGHNRYRITGHALRHGYATYCANETEMPIHKLKRLMGHEDIETTLKYVEEDDETLREAQEMYAPR